MTRDKFLKDLSGALSKVSREERQKTIDYYREIIDDKVESGMTEDEAVAQLGDIASIADSLTPEKPSKGNGLRTALIYIGSPIWLSLLIALAAVVISLIAAAAAIAISIVAVDVAFALSGAALVIAFVPLLWQNVLTAVFSLGAGLVLAGLAILIYAPARKAVPAVWRFAKRAWNSMITGIKNRRNTK